MFYFNPLLLYYISTNLPVVVSIRSIPLHYIFPITQYAKGKATSLGAIAVLGFVRILFVDYGPLSLLLETPFSGACSRVAWTGGWNCPSTA